jgi:hypothetical protein
LPTTQLEISLATTNFCAPIFIQIVGCRNLLLACRFKRIKESIYSPAAPIFSLAAYYSMTRPPTINQFDREQSGKPRTFEIRFFKGLGYFLVFQIIRQFIHNRDTHILRVWGIQDNELQPWLHLHWITNNWLRSKFRSVAASCWESPHLWRVIYTLQRYSSEPWQAGSQLETCLEPSPFTSTFSRSFTSLQISRY